MGYFPMCVELTGKTVFLIGSGEQIRHKREKLSPFGAILVQKDGFTEEDARQAPALVIAGDQPMAEAERISDLCRRYRIPVNVVDVPRLCTVFFPALINRGELTVSISTGGSSPEMAACLRKRIEAQLPEDLEQILLWVAEQKDDLRRQKIMKQAVAAALEKGRLLTREEVALLTK